MKFSIIIPVRTINNYLKENIEHLQKLTYQDFEVIIITDDREPYTFNDPRFTLLSSGKVGPGEKRNLGAKNSTGEILAFLDDDAYPASDWLNQAATILADPETYALGGPAMTPPDAEFKEKCSGRILESFLASAGTRYRHLPKTARNIDDYPSVNLFVRKEAFDKVGGYTKDFWPGEDTKLCLDLLKAYNREFRYDPRPIVYHHRRDVFKPHLEQVSRYGKHRGQFARIFPENSRAVSFFIPSMFVTGLVIGPLMSLVFYPFWFVYEGFILIYLGWDGYEIFKVYRKDSDWKLAFYTGLGIFLTHIVYGANFIRGFIFKPQLKLRNVDKNGNYVGG